MKKIVGILRPFAICQKFYVYQDGNQIESIETTISKIPETIFILTQKYNINQIDLTGPQHYTDGIVQKIKKQEILKYQKNELKFHII